MIKMAFKTLYKLIVVCMMYGLMSFIYTGCSPPVERSSAGFVFLPALNPPNSAAYDDVFFKHYGTNPFIDTEDDHLSTFGMDVDTASYAVTRRYLRGGDLPPPEAVRVEEFVNAFNY